MYAYMLFSICNVYLITSVLMNACMLFSICTILYVLYIILVDMYHPYISYLGMEVAVCCESKYARTMEGVLPFLDKVDVCIGRNSVYLLGLYMCIYVYIIYAYVYTQVYMELD